MALEIGVKYGKLVEISLLQHGLLYCAKDGRGGYLLPALYADAAKELVFAVDWEFMHPDYPYSRIKFDAKCLLGEK